MRKRNVTLAGEELNLSQSAISNGLKRLRDHFDDKLFVSSPAGMMPTALAEQLAGPIQESLTQIQLAIESVKAFDPSSSTKNFKIYISDVGQLILIPNLVTILTKAAPQVTLSLVNLSPRVAQSMMADGEIDLAIGTFDRFQAGFHQQRLFSKSYVVLARKDHSLLKKGLSLQTFLNARHAVYLPPAASHDSFDLFLDDLFKQNNKRRQVVVELAHGLGIAEIVAASDLIACVPKRLAESLMSTQSLGAFPLPFEAPGADVCQFWHDRVHSDPGHRWFRNLVYKNYSRMIPGKSVGSY
jgi:DNA-binding transcriptional LysR family regulator